MSTQANYKKDLPNSKYTYDLKTKRWRNSSGLVKLANRIKGKSGAYYLLNSDGTVSMLMDAKKNFTNVNTNAKDRKLMQSGHASFYATKNTNKDNQLKDLNNRYVYRNGKWVDITTGKAAKKLVVGNSGYTYHLNSDGSITNKQVELKLKEQKENEYDFWDEGIVGGAGHWLAKNVFGASDETAKTVGSILGIGDYFIPYYGAAKAVGDIGHSFATGDIEGGLMDAAFVIVPGGKVLKKLPKFGRAINAGSKTMNAFGKIERAATSKPAQYLYTGSNALIGGLMAKTGYNAYQYGLLSDGWNWATNNEEGTKNWLTPDEDPTPDFSKMSDEELYKLAYG